MDYSRILQEKPQMSLDNFCTASSAGAQRGAKQLQDMFWKNFKWKVKVKKKLSHEIGERAFDKVWCLEHGS